MSLAMSLSSQLQIPFWSDDLWTNLFSIKEIYIMKNTGEIIAWLCQWNKIPSLSKVNLLDKDISENKRNKNEQNGIGIKKDSQNCIKDVYFFMTPDKEIIFKPSTVMSDINIIELDQTDSHIVTQDLRHHLKRISSGFEIAVRSPIGLSIISSNSNKKLLKDKDQDHSKIRNFCFSCPEEDDKKYFVGPFLRLSQLVWHSLSLPSPYQQMSVLFNYAGISPDYDKASTIFLAPDSAFSPVMMSQFLDTRKYSLLLCFLLNHFSSSYLSPQPQHSVIQSFTHHPLSVHLSSSLNTVLDSNITGLISQSPDKIIYSLDHPLTFDLDLCSSSRPLSFSPSSLFDIGYLVLQHFRLYLSDKFSVMKEEILILQDSLDYFFKLSSSDSCPVVSNLSSLLSLQRDLSSLVKQFTSHLSPSC